MPECCLCSLGQRGAQPRGTAEGQLVTPSYLSMPGGSGSAGQRQRVLKHPNHAVVCLRLFGCGVSLGICFVAVHAQRCAACCAHSGATSDDLCNDKLVRLALVQTLLPGWGQAPDGGTLLLQHHCFRERSLCKFFLIDMSPWGE